MIQRIQTVYLLIASILLGFMVIRPIAQIYRTANDAIFDFGFKGLTGNDVFTEGFNSVPMSILMALCLVICISTIFLFKKRMLQIRLSVVNIVLLVGLEGLMYYYVRTAESTINGIVSYSILFIFPLVAAILVFLALRSIARDEALIRSLNRLR
jgi:hypothetical protein